MATENEDKAKELKSAEEGLQPCDKPFVAEATRTTEADEACDDGIR
ncbi:MAG: hypothetical protein JXM71_01005 [Spirochaetales bacterium]|nr:hypothetical protein [Spirochaetales bacterium]